MRRISVDETTRLIDDKWHLRREVDLVCSFANYESGSRAATAHTKSRKTIMNIYARPWLKVVWTSVACNSPPETLSDGFLQHVTYCIFGDENNRRTLNFKAATTKSASLIFKERYRKTIEAVHFIHFITRKRQSATYWKFITSNCLATISI